MWTALRFLVFRWILRLLRLGPKSDDADVEIAVLRHQLAIQQRQVPRPRYNDLIGRDPSLLWFDQIVDASSAKPADSLSGGGVSTPSS